MGDRFRGLIVVLVVVAVGAYLGSAASQWFPDLRGGVSQAGGVSTETAERTRPLGRVRVEVLNAAGIEGLARSATETLRERGFDVVYFGNADSFDADSTVVLDRVGRLPAARAVADSLGVRRVWSEPDSNLYLDVTVRLGRDWTPPEEPSGLVPANPAPEAGERWWDPRRLWRPEPAIDPEETDGDE